MGVWCGLGLLIETKFRYKKYFTQVFIICARATCSKFMP
jgi:hypothetical protein